MQREYRHAPYPEQRGFTLIELLMTIVILGIVAAVGSNMISNNMTSAMMVNSGQGAMDRARYTMDRVARELREVSFNTTTGTYAISGLGPNATSVTFTRVINATSTTVTIARSGASLNLTYLPSGGTAVTSALTNNVTSFSMNFYDTDGAATTSTADLEFVEVILGVTESATSGQSVSQRMRISLRNS